MVMIVFCLKAADSHHRVIIAALHSDWRRAMMKHFSNLRIIAFRTNVPASKQVHARINWQGNPRKVKNVVVDPTEESDVGGNWDINTFTAYLRAGKSRNIERPRRSATPNMLKLSESKNNTTKWLALLENPFTLSSFSVPHAWHMTIATAVKGFPLNISPPFFTQVSSTSIPTNLKSNHDAYGNKSHRGMIDKIRLLCGSVKSVSSIRAAIMHVPFPSDSGNFCFHQLFNYARREWRTEANRSQLLPE